MKLRILFLFRELVGLVHVFPLLEVGEEVEVVPFVVVVFGVAVEIDGPTLEHFSINIAYHYIHQKRRGEEERRRGEGRM